MSGTEEPALLERREGGVVVLTMNVPDKRNALVPAIREGLIEAFARLDEDRDCRAIVLTGAGPAFCAGGDISNPGPFTGPQVRMLMKRPQRLLRAIAGHSKPVIAAVDGPACGALMTSANMTTSRTTPMLTRSGRLHSSPISGITPIRP